MALIFVDGFDFWTTPPGCWTSDAGTVSVAAGKLSVRPTSTGDHWIRWTFPASIQTVIVNIRTAFAEKTAFIDEPVFTLFFGDTAQCTVAVNSAGQLSVWRGKVGTGAGGVHVGGFSTLGFVQDGVTYYDIEAKIVVANSGSCIIQVNGDEVLNVTGDLAASATESCNNILFGKQSGVAQNTAETLHEHVVIMDTTGTAMNDFIGPIKVNPHYLTADGFYTDFTANTGARWDAVNDLDPDGSATYITANAVGNKYTAVASNLPAGITNVYALAVWAKSQRSDDVTRAYKALLRYAAADQLGSDDKYIGPNYAYQISTFDVSPFSATAWTPTEIDGLEVGVQITV